MLNVMLGLLMGLLLGGVVCSAGVASPIFGPASEAEGGSRPQPAGHDRAPAPAAGPTDYLC